MKREEVFAFTAGCYSGEPASCTFACPFRLDLRSFLKKAGRGRWSAAAKELAMALPFHVRAPVSGRLSWERSLWPSE